MKNQWMTYMTGRVIVRIEGKGIERFINTIVRSGLVIWKVKKLSSAKATFYIGLQDIHKLRKLTRRAPCTLYFLKGEGLPFLWRRLLKNIGFLIGPLLFLLIAFVLSNITWGIHIKGADPETEYKIKEELTNMGIEIGRSHLTGDKPDVIQKRLTESIDNITWVGVELKGTTYHFQVVQKTEQEEQKQLTPRHLVANKKAVIRDIFVEKGIPNVKVNDYVEKGQLLVSGLIGDEEKPNRIVAKGKVWGETWYNTHVEFPIDSTFQVLNGESVNKYYLLTNKKKLPIWGFKEIPFNVYETDKDQRNLYLFGKKLPFVYSKETIREKEEQKRRLTKEEAVQAAKTLARRDVERSIPSDAKIDKEIILQEEVKNGKVKLSINFQVIENIAKEKPIIQGD